MRPPPLWRRTGVIAMAFAVVATACTDGGERSEPRTLEMWFHASEGPERALLEQQVERFNETHAGITVLVRVLPEGSYDDQVAEAATDGSLPDLLDVNRLTLAAGEAGPLVAIEELLPRDVIDSLVPEVAQLGRMGSRLVGVPTTAEVVLLGADRRALRALDATVPSGVDDPWTLADFEEVLTEAAATRGAPALELPDEPRDLGTALVALVRSAGGPLLGPEAPAATDLTDTLTTPAALLTATVVSRWLREDLASPRTAEPEEDEVEPAPLELVSSAQLDPHQLPAAPPDLGGGVASVAVGHIWVIPEGSRHPAEAAALVAFLLSPPEVAAAVEAAGGVPVAETVLDEMLASGLEQHRAAALAARLLLEHRAAPIPIVADGPELLTAYANAVTAAGDGEEVRSALAGAARALGT